MRNLHNIVMLVFTFVFHLITYDCHDPIYHITAGTLWRKNTLKLKTSQAMAFKLLSHRYPEPACNCHFYKPFPPYLREPSGRQTSIGTLLFCI